MFLEMDKLDYTGSGEFGRVFEDSYDGKDVTYKIMKHGVPASMFLNEIRIMDALQGHEGITDLIGYSFRENDSFVIVMERATSCGP